MYDKIEWFTTDCKNRSHDICYLILNLVTAYQKETLKDVAIKMCDLYREKKSSSPNTQIDRDKDYNGYHWNDEIFHWHYVGYLEDIELEPYTPNNLLKGLRCILCKIKF